MLFRSAQVFWPVDEGYVPFLAPAAPYATFLPVAQGGRKEDYFVHTPRAMLSALGCGEIHALYNAMLGDERLVVRPQLNRHLKFDEHKYAVAGVPFSEKWNLRIERDPAREERLFESLDIRRPYVCVHLRSKDFAPAIALPEEWRRDYQVVEVGERTDNPFDWIATLENASELLLIDSCFSNLVEQLDLPVPKSLVLRSRIEFTPVMKNDWRFYALG